MVDINKILSNSEFDKIDPVVKSAFIELGQDLEGKNQMETMKILVNFNKNYLSKITFTDDEENAMYRVIKASLNSSESKQFETIYSMMKKMR